ncbi:MAG: transglycosylase SLT domain-containing protein [Nitrospirae bacterium]|nr:transglycosylase SLT domain-containing protein [Nitrospirota bacterium]
MLEKSLSCFGSVLIVLALHLAAPAWSTESGRAHAEPPEVGVKAVQPRPLHETVTNPDTPDTVLADFEAHAGEAPAAHDVAASQIALRAQPNAPGLLKRFAEQFADWGSSIRAANDPHARFRTLISYVPLVRNQKVERHIRYFQHQNPKQFKAWLTRFSRYRPLVDEIFSEFGLPPDLVFLSLIESGFNPIAYSRARATGAWQFMKGTAKHYGLRVNWYVDERRDPIKSTVAAARHLRNLYDRFGTWPLAMAAYNAGERKVQRALRKARAESYWEIAQTRYIRRETREYVPRFMAAAIIAKNPEHFGFRLAPQDPYQFDEVVVRRSVHFRSIARATGISSAELRRLNPELRRKVTPPYASAYYLKVPVGTKATVEEALPRIKAPKGKTKGKGAGWYKVRVGDSLWKIAKRFRLTVAELKALNSLISHRIKPGDLLAVVP